MARHFHVPAQHAADFQAHLAARGDDCITLLEEFFSEPPEDFVMAIAMLAQNTSNEYIAEVRSNLTDMGAAFGEMQRNCRSVSLASAPQAEKHDKAAEHGSTLQNASIRLNENFIPGARTVDAGNFYYYLVTAKFYASMTKGVSHGRPHIYFSAGLDEALMKLGLPRLPGFNNAVPEQNVEALAKLLDRLGMNEMSQDDAFGRSLEVRTLS